jgi:hypothetical protein
MPVCLNIFPTTFCTCFKVSGLILRSLIYFALVFVQVRDMALVSVFCMQIASFPSNIRWRGCLLHCIFWAPLSKMRWMQLHGFISGPSILFHWFSCLFLCQYHAVFTSMALLYRLKSGIVTLPALVFLLSIASAIKIFCAYIWILGLTFQSLG